MPIPLTSETLINVATSGDQRVADAAALADGRTVIAWIDAGAGGGVAKFRLLGADGAPAAGEITVAEAAEVQAAALTGGGFVVAWIVGSPSQSSVRAQLYDAAGQSQGGVQTLASDTIQIPPNLLLQSVGLEAIGLSDGGFAVTWATQRSDSFASHSVFNRLVVAGPGGAVEADIALSAAPSGKTLPLYDPDATVVELSGGRILLTWRVIPTSGGPAGGPGGQFAQIYDLNGAAIGSTLALDPSIPADGGPVIDSSQGLAAAALPGGKIAFAWQSGGSLWVSIYPESGLGQGNLTGRTQPVRVASEVAVGEPQLAALPDGRFVVAWSAGGDAIARMFDTSGAPSGDAFRIGDIAEGTQDLVQLTTRSDGYLLAAWRDDSHQAPAGQPADASGAGVKAQLLAFVGGQTGSPTSDTMTGGAAPDQLNGGAGEDRLAGLGGADTLDGGRDGDVLIGGAGDDLLIGGLGFDYAEFAVAVAANLTTGRASGDGADILSGVEGLRGSVFADTLSGNYLGNVLSGAGGDDVIAGDIGSNYLDGGEGSDTLVLPGGLGDYFVQGSTVTSPWGVSTAVGFERVQIAGANLSWSQLTEQAFDGLRYIASNPDLIVAYGANATAGRQHWTMQGQGEGRALATFDPFLYGSSNPDLLAFYGADARALTLHYVLTGFGEGRTSGAFDALQYGAAHDDLLRAFGTDQGALARHYAATGVFEGRAINGFDATAYLISNPDLAAAGLGVEGAFRHWIFQGANEGRRGDELFGRDQASHEIGVGGAVSGELENRLGERPANDHDWFSVQLAAGQRVTIDVHGATQLVDTRLDIYDALGRLVASDENSGGIADPRLDLTAGAAGSYFIVVSSSPGAEGNYELAVSQSPAAASEGWLI